MTNGSLAANRRTVNSMTASIFIAGALLLYVAWLYNRLVTLRSRTRNAWAQVDVQLRRRSDLVPNLVKCVKGYIAHEGRTLTTMIELRREAVAAATSIAARAVAETELAQSLRLLLATAEAFPRLRASENMLELQEELRATENPGHLVACHLTAAEKTRQWALLSAGKLPDDVKETVPQGGVEA